MRFLLCLASFLVFSIPASAGPVSVPSGPSKLPLNEIGIEQRLNAPLPTELEFFDETGRTVKLSEYFDGKPVILSFVYHRCPMMCGTVTNGLVQALKMLSLEPGRDFRVITVSIDPTDTPKQSMEKKLAAVKQYGKPVGEKGWVFLTGAKADVEKFAESAGFRYVYDEKADQYAHASGIMVATPDGKLARYFYGIEYSPRDLRFALVEASQGKIGNPIDQFLLLCFHYNPALGKYGLVIQEVLKILCFATLFALGGFVIGSLVKERRKRKEAQSDV